MSSIKIRKSVITAFGGPENVTIMDDVLAPPPSKHVQVKILYSGMGGGDIQMRQGTYPLQRKAPLTPGYIFIGRVHENGPGSEIFSVGDLVCSLSMYDGQSTYANFAEKHLIPVPVGLEHSQVIPLILDWSTAYGMVFRSGKVSKGQRVFIHGLSGSVGYALFKLCQLQGAECHGTASSSKHADLRADGAIPYTYANKDWIKEMNAVGGAHVVFDPLGFESWDESWSILAREGGHLIGYGGNLDLLSGGKPRSQIPCITKLLARNLLIGCPNKTSFFAIRKEQKTYVPELKELFKLLQEGKIQVPIKTLISLEEVPEAHKQWNKMTGIGSVVVRVGEDNDA